MLRRATRIGLAGLGLLLAVMAPLAGWGVASQSADVWPVRNTLQYAAVMRWWVMTGRPRGGEASTLTGTVRDSAGRGVADGRVLVTAWDGTAYSAKTGVDGAYRVDGVPAGQYAVVAGAPGRGETAIEGVRVGDGAGTLDIRLSGARPERAVAGGGVMVSGREVVSSNVPIAGRAVRWEVTISGRGTAERGRVLLYLPVEVNVASTRLPLLLTAYPGPAEEWESASVPLAAAGYAVVAYAPPYSFTPEDSVGEMRGLLAAAQRGELPGVDGARVGVLAGSYSGLHALRVLQEEYGNAGVKGAVLMGAPTDLFDMRRRLEDRSFVPPFGLDQALVALGFPDRETVRYWRYSGTYQVRRGMVGMLLVHSRRDEVVPYQQSEMLGATMREVGAEVEVVLLEGGSHYLLSAEEEARQIYELTLEFLRERLG